MFNGTVYRDLTAIVQGEINRRAFILLEDLLRSENSIDDFVQPRALWDMWKDNQRGTNFVDNISGHLNLVKDREIVSNQRALYSACQLSCYSHLPPSFSPRLQKC